MLANSILFFLQRCLLASILLYLFSGIVAMQWNLRAKLNYAIEFKLNWKYMEVENK
jgi:hypothetical protein